jgi:uncharacterized membrane protein YfcA
VLAALTDVAGAALAALAVLGLLLLAQLLGVAAMTAAGALLAGRLTRRSDQRRAWRLFGGICGFLLGVLLCIGLPWILWSTR